MRTRRGRDRGQRGRALWPRPWSVECGPGVVVYVCVRAILRLYGERAARRESEHVVIVMRFLPVSSWF